MNARDIRVVYRKELKEMLRDRRTMISMVVLPLLLFPVMVLGIGSLASSLMGNAKKEVPTVMVAGGEDSPRLMEQLHAAQDFHFEPAQPDFQTQVSEKKIRAAVVVPPGFDAAEQSAAAQTITIDYYEGDVNSSLAADKLEKYFDNLRDDTVKQRLEARQVPVAVLEPFTVEQKNVAPPEKVAGATLGGIIPYLVIIMSFTGAMYPAMDSTAGEKERGTLETLLCSPVSRTDLVLGKYLTVLTASVTSALLAVASMGISFYYGQSIFTSDNGGGESMHLQIGLRAVLAVLLMVLPLSMFFSGLLLAVSLFAKSFREADSYKTPLTFLIVIPAVVSMLPGIDLNVRTAMIPVLGTSLVSKELVSGTYHWGYIAMIFGFSCVYAAVALAVTIVLFNREEVLFRV
jgi:sodium transport system permease protein